MILWKAIIYSLLSVCLALEKRQDGFDINQPDKWINNKDFLKASAATCIGLITILGPLIAFYIYKKRKSAIVETDEINTVFKSSNPVNASSRKPRISSMLLDDKRMSAVSSFTFAFPSNQTQNQDLDYSNQIQNPVTYSTIFRDSLINDSMSNSEVMVHMDSIEIPPPFDKIQLDKSYVIQRYYNASEYDEMNVLEGDIVVVHKVYEDGWVLCMNQNNKNQGVIPSDCFDF